MVRRAQMDPLAPQASQMTQRGKKQLQVMAQDLSRKAWSQQSMELCWKMA